MNDITAIGSIFIHDTNIVSQDHSSTQTKPFNPQNNKEIKALEHATTIQDVNFFYAQAFNDNLYNKIQRI